MTEKKSPEPYFAPAQEVRIVEKADGPPDEPWPDDARQIADQAGLGSYGEDPDLSSERDQLWNALTAVEEELQALMRHLRGLWICLVVLLVLWLMLAWDVAHPKAPRFLTPSPEVSAVPGGRS